MGTDAPEIGVLEGQPGTHIFSWLADPRLRICPAGHAGPFDQRIVVLPAYRGLEFIDHDAVLPDEVWRPARAGEGVVVFDASREGWPHDARTTRELHGFAERVGVSPRHCVYLTQDRAYAADYRAHCRRLGLEPMTVINADYWIRRLLAGVAPSGEADFVHRRKAFKLRPRARERRFIALNYTPRPSRVLFLLRLLRDGLWESGFISFGGLEHVVGLKGVTQDQLERRLFRLEGFEDLSAELRPLLPQLAAMGQVVLGSSRKKPTIAKLSGDMHLPEYDASWFSVVTETEMEDRLLRITEKALKPLLNFHPMIVLGNPGSLRLIRELGFRTFGEVFDERYDEEPDPRRRFEMVYAEVQRLCALDERELVRLEKAVYETLAFNAEWGLVGLPRLCRERLDAELVDSILTAGKGRPTSKEDAA